MSHKIDTDRIAEDLAFQREVLKGVEVLADSQRHYRRELDAMRRKILDGGDKLFVSAGCAEAMTAAVVLRAANCGRLGQMSPAKRDASIAKAEGILKQKTALTSTDIPLPVDYGTELASLVAQYGTARKYGLIAPLATGEAKLPRLKTSPAFGLITPSMQIPELIPQMEYVDFRARKWGGVVRLPSEIYEDQFGLLGTFLAEYTARELAKIEDVVYWTSDGSGIYDGLYGLVPQVITLGKTSVLGSGKTAPSDITLANIRLVRGQVSSAALGNSAYYLHRSHEAMLCGFNTNGNTPYLFASAQGEPRLDGYPVRWVETLPPYDNTPAASRGQVVFGDLRYHWLGIAGEIRIDTSLDAGFANDEIVVRALERFTTGLMAPDAVGVLRLAAQ